MKKLPKNQKGFTIIEVLIVLAIAGLILLIVFLAVPALQRNSRNTQYKNQVSSYLGAVNEFTNNNNGRIPSSSGDVSTVNGLSADGPITEPTGTVSGARSNAVAIGSMELVTSANCDTNNVGNTIGGSSRSVAIRYSVENSTGGAVPQCTGS